MEAKQAAGQAAAQLAENGMRLGLGTGSTTAFALAALGARIRAEGLRVAGVPTSFAAERLARAHGIPLTTLDDGPLDLALDGADEVDGALNLIKGRGGAHAREKVVAAAAARFVVVADPSKQVARLGEAKPVPVEVLPMAVGPVRRLLDRSGAAAVTLRMAEAKDGPVVTDQGLWMLDARFDGAIPDPAALDRVLCDAPGVLDHGLFLGLASDVLIGHDDGSVEHLTRAGG
jgi:ribose 5-phosphate isomerase A